MSVWVRLITQVHQVLVAFYPSGFRSEFGEEMQEVFAAVLTEDQHPGGERTWQRVWREFYDLPGSIVQAHLRARRRKMPVTGFIEEEPLPHSEMLAALIIFILPLFSIFFSMIALTGIRLPPWTGYFLIILFWGAVFFALGLAVIRGLPRWSLSYLGFVLIPGIFLSLSPVIGRWLYPNFIQAFGPRSFWSVPGRIIYLGIFDFIIWYVVLLSTLILVNLLRLLPYTRAVWQRIRADWTQLSFMIYGGLVFGVLLLFEEYRHEDVWKFMAWASLALGAWWYLRAKGQKQRLLALMGGATGALWIVALAKWVLIPLQAWPTGYPVAPSETSRWVETSTAIIHWLWILIVMMAPALLNLLPQAPGPLVPTNEDPLTS